ncbi:MAG: hypothetical protein A2Y33_06460 [Spirochaetes bacterium GWF1_51_8]|nr:MAG: hypothetical protein A2Y33_06460 [Spirochaetes bacterium GWF1_51_8]
MNSKELKEVVRSERIVPILRTDSAKELEGVCAAVRDSGIKIIEFTMTIPGVIDELPRLKSKFPELVFGLGTVFSEQDAAAAIENGADFIVSPIAALNLVEPVKSRDKLLMLAAFTPTEIYTIHKAGSDVIKLFPASALTPSYIKAIKGPMPFVDIMPTGGIDLILGMQYLAGGAIAVGMGETVFNKEQIKRGNFEKIIAALKNARERLRGIVRK